MTITIERRGTHQAVEFRAADGGSGLGVIGGYALVFDTLSRDLGGFCEEFAPEAFGAPVEGGGLDLSLHTRVICRSEHDSRLLLGATDSGTLRVFVDDTGIRYEDDLPNTSAGRDAAVLAERGDYRFSSFSFTALDEQWRQDADGRLVRRVTRATLHDVSPVADPAYWSSSTAMLRAIDLEAVRASLIPPPTEPGEREAAVRRAAAAMTRETHPALVTRTRKRGI